MMTPEPDKDLVEALREATNYLKQLPEIAKCLGAISSVLEVEKRVERLETAASNLEQEAKKLSSPLTSAKREILAIVLLLSAVVLYGLALWLLIVPKLVIQNLNAVGLWHNIALLFFPTVAFAFFVWAIVKLFQTE